MNANRQRTIILVTDARTTKGNGCVRKQSLMRSQKKKFLSSYTHAECFFQGNCSMAARIAFLVFPVLGPSSIIFLSLLLSQCTQAQENSKSLLSFGSMQGSDWVTEVNQTRLSTVIPTRTFGSQEAQGLFLPLGLNLYSFSIWCERNRDRIRKKLMLPLFAPLWKPRRDGTKERTCKAVGREQLVAARQRGKTLNRSLLENRQLSPRLPSKWKQNLNVQQRRPWHLTSSLTVTPGFPRHRVSTVLLFKTESQTAGLAQTSHSAITKSIYSYLEVSVNKVLHNLRSPAPGQVKHTPFDLE